MLRTTFLLVVLLLSSIPSLAQSGSASSQPVQITGVVLSLSGNTLDVKPAASPAVWVTLPDDLKVDRGGLKPGADVSVEARWAEVCYVATKVTIQK
ncbi:MAG TPA: hypothetical protein VEJ46_02875 [Candidatus Acidoferrum sp.]|nr:hypothetical protein [Candidatus Acidoferrum sp.]